MDRKKALIGAATVAGSLLAASSAFALTSGVLDSDADDGAGDLSPVVEMPTTAPTTPPTSMSGSDDRTDDERTTATEDDGRFGDDDGVDHEDEADDAEHESDEPFEYEGREDDD